MKVVQRSSHYGPLWGLGSRSCPVPERRGLHRARALQRGSTWSSGFGRTRPIRRTDNATA